jgi:RNA recognition motif-containing protein
VGNLPFRTTRYELRELFQPYGKIHSARIVIDRATKKPRGYGFVEMDSKGAEKAVSSLNGHTLAGRNLKVSEANDRE